MNRKRLHQVLTQHEGRRNLPYRDTLGNLTIGVGRNLTAKGISDREIDYLLANDIQEAEDFLDKRMTWWRDLDAVRQEALLNLAFNMGGKLLQFSKALNLLGHKEYERAGECFLKGTGEGGKSKWYCQVGRRAEHVTNAIKHGKWT